MTDNELNEMVAEKVMGFVKLRYVYPSPYPNNDGVLLGTVYGQENPIPDYVNDIAAAWQVVEKLPYYVEVSKTSDGRYFCKVNPMEATAQANTAPRAICLAALEAAGVEA